MYKIIFINDNCKQKYSIHNIPCATNFMNRLFGLMLKEKFNGMIFKSTSENRFLNSIHTCFMKKRIDVIYVTHNMEIQEYTTLKTWKLYIPKKGKIKYIIELPENSIKKFHLDKTTRVVIRDENNLGNNRCRSLP